MSQLYGSILTREPSGDVLPAVQDLGLPKRVTFGLDQLKYLIANAIGPDAFAPDDLMKAYTEPVAGCVNAVCVAATKLPQTPLFQGPNRAPVAEAKTFQDALAALHVSLVELLTLISPKRGSSYVLGRWLTALCWGTTSTEDVWERFATAKLSDLQSVLKDLKGSVPPLTVAAVSGGIDNWATWLTVVPLSAWPPDIADHLEKQGEHWRALLAGEKDPTALLTPEAWVAAGQSVILRGKVIARRAASTFWVLIVVVLGLAAGGVVLALLEAAGTAKVWGALVSAAAGLGITGKSLATGTRRVASQAGNPISELTHADAVAWAATWLPPLPPAARAQKRVRKGLRRAGLEMPNRSVPANAALVARGSAAGAAAAGTRPG
ncbi:MAG: hypothetical protein M3Y36_02205 [Actinomycetota bacterium]|nr:hypothetical protein [Actinomycetota bacterium]